MWPNLVWNVKNVAVRPWPLCCTPWRSQEWMNTAKPTYRDHRSIVDVFQFCIQWHFCIWTITFHHYFDTIGWLCWRMWMWSDLLHEESDTEWMGVSRAKSTCIELYKLLNGIVLKHLCDSVKVKEQVSNLRSNVKANIARHRTRSKFAEEDLLIRGTYYWELLNTDTKNARRLLFAASLY